MMNDVKNRPKHLNLLQIRQPLPAVLSILHRISGVILFFSIPVLLAAFNMSLWAEGFQVLKSFFALPLIKAVLLLLTWAFLHHICAGVRFLLIDLHVGVEKSASKMSAQAVFVVSILLTILFAWRVVL